MPEFHYTAVDSRGSPVSGRITAAGTEAALRELSADKGLTGICLGEVAPPPPRQGWLSTEDAVELARGLADLTRSGLPLAGGLRAMAAELPGYSMKSVLGDLARQLEAGVPLDHAIHVLGDRLPAHLRGVVLAGLRGGRLAEVLDEYVEIKQAEVKLRRRIWRSLTYPLVLLSAVALMTAFFQLYILPPFMKIYDDFDSRLPLITRCITEGTGPIVGLMIGGVLLLVTILVGLTALPTMSWGPRLLYRTPLIGPLWRFGRLAQFARLTGVLLEQKVPLPEALRLAATGLNDAYLAQGAIYLAEGVEAGQPLAECMALQRLYPPTMIPLVDWGQRTNALAGAFRASAEMFEGRVQVQGKTFEAVLLPLVCVWLFVCIGLFVTAMFMPLISVIQMLT